MSSESWPDHAAVQRWPAYGKRCRSSCRARYQRGQFLSHFLNPGRQVPTSWPSCPKPSCRTDVCQLVTTANPKTREVPAVGPLLHAVQLADNDQPAAVPTYAEEATINATDVQRNANFIRPCKCTAAADPELRAKIEPLSTITRIRPPTKSKPKQSHDPAAPRKVHAPLLGCAQRGFPRSASPQHHQLPVCKQGLIRFTTQIEH
jgi:hypothetical protein